MPRPGMLDPRYELLREQRQHHQRGRGQSQNHLGLLAAAGCARKEDHALSVARDLVKFLDHPRPTSPEIALQRNRGPQARIQLPAELLDQPLFVLDDADIAFSDQHLTVSRPHPQEAHVRDYVKGGALSGSPSTSTGPAPAPSWTSPRSTDAAAMSFALRAASNGESPQA